MTPESRISAMSYARYIKEVASATNDSGGLTEQDAYELFGAMLDGGVAELEVGALLVALRAKGESLAELIGFSAALNERVFRLSAPASGPRPVVLPSYGGARTLTNLLPLLALLLQRFGVPV